MPIDGYRNRGHAYETNDQAGKSPDRARSLHPAICGETRIGQLTVVDEMIAPPGSSKNATAFSNARTAT